MKILILHTEYQHKGGEDTVVRQEQALLEPDHEVRTVLFKNKSGLQGALQFLFSIWNINVARKVKKHIQQYRPDVIHIHNWHFAMGPLVIRTAKRVGVPIVVTLHNYRLLCPSAILLHNGVIFRDSIQASFPWAAIRKKVYRDSYLQTFWLSFINWWHRKIGTWNMVQQYIALSAFGKELFCNSSLGVAASKFTIKSNFVSGSTGSLRHQTGCFLYVGRLSEEKGIRVLLEAFQNKPDQLQIAGDGPLQQMVLEACKNSKNIHYLGSRNKKEVEELMAGASLFILPSICYEGMPVTIIEAFSVGTPVVTSKMGAMSSMIEHGVNGFHFRPGNPESLYEQVTAWFRLTSLQKECLRQEAQAAYWNYYTPEKNLNQLLTIYQSLTKPSETETFKYRHDHW